MNREDVEEFRELCQQIGLMTLTWAWAESVLAMTIGVINGHAGPIKGFDEPPLMLKNRVKCLRAALRDIAILKPLQQDGRLLAVRFLKLAKCRNQFIHGAAIKHSDGGFEATNITLRAGEYAIEDHRFDVADAVSLNAQIAELSNDATAYMFRVTTLFGA